MLFVCTHMPLIWLTEGKDDWMTSHMCDIICCLMIFAYNNGSLSLWQARMICLTLVYGLFLYALLATYALCNIMENKMIDIKLT